MTTIESLCAQIENIGRTANELIDNARRERDEARADLQRLHQAIKALQSTCCGDDPHKCHGCKTLIALLAVGGAT